MRQPTTTYLLLALLFIAAPSLQAQPDPATVRASIVQVAVIGANGVRRVGSGFAVSAEGHVLTAAHLVANEDRIVAVPLATGAELVARIVYANGRADLALLAVNGLALPPLKLASDGFEPGRMVYSAGVWSESGEPVLVATADEDVLLASTEGAVGKHDDLAATDGALAVPLMEHNAMIPAAGYGGPVLNECGEVAGLNRGSPGVSAWRLRRGKAPEGVVHAVRVTAVAGLLQPQGVEFVRSDTPCARALTAAQAQAEAAQAEAELTAQQLEEATGQAEATRQQLEQTQQEKNQAAARAATAESRVSDLEGQYQEAVRTGAEETEAVRAELDAARGDQTATQAAVGALEGEVAALEERLRQEAAADRMRLIITVASFAILVAVVGIVASIFLRKRSHQLALVREEAARARRDAAAARSQGLESAAYPECMLTGATGDGNAVSIKVTGRLLTGEGVIIGRSPRNSTFLVDDRTLSREHARLFGDNDTLYLEDLGSTNGTKLNGSQLHRGTPVEVAGGDVIEFGAVKVELVVGD